MCSAPIPGTWGTSTGGLVSNVPAGRSGPSLEMYSEEINRTSVGKQTTATAPRSDAGKSTKKCGACGLSGHDRGSATAENCPNYHDEKEVQLRAKKKEQNRLKAQRAREQRRQIEQHSATMNTQLQEAERVLARLREAAIANNSMSENEMRRLRREEARAKKQARKFE